MLLCASAVSLSGPSALSGPELVRKKMKGDDYCPILEQVYLDHYVFFNMGHLKVAMGRSVKQHNRYGFCFN